MLACLLIATNPSVYDEYPDELAKLRQPSQMQQLLAEVLNFRTPGILVTASWLK
jgi:hypothetical protein